MFRVKIAVLGPSKSGKTVLSNFLADATDISGKEYHSTQGVRILEFESSELDVSGKSVKADVELWDCGGDKKFESCWPAIIKDANGAILIYNPDQSNHISEIDLWRRVAAEIPDSNCLILCYEKPKTKSAHPNKLGDKYSKIMKAEVDMDQESDKIHTVFNKFLGQLIGNLAEGRDQDELNIMSEIRVNS